MELAYLEGSQPDGEGILVQLREALVAFDSFIAAAIGNALHSS